MFLHATGIQSSLDLKGLTIADSKHKGLLPLVKGRTLHNFEVRAAHIGVV